MLDRRGFIQSAAGALVCLSGAPALGQTLRPGATGPGSPAGTSPFPPEIFRARRQRLMQMMGGGAAVIFSAASLSNGPVGGGARQDSDFAYLTGIHDEAGAALLLAPGERTHKEFLFLASRDPDTERWDGERLIIGGAVRERTGFERVYRTGSVGRRLIDVASRAPRLHYLGPLAAPAAPIPQALALYQEVTSRLPGSSIVNSSGLLARMRRVKEPGELALIRRAVAATERGLRAGMAAVRPGMREFELKRIIESEFAAAGATGLAFPSIVGTGRNGAVAHYAGNDGIIGAGDLIVADVGAEVGHYAADITRTFPASGRFSPEQRAVYQTVLRAQEAAMSLLRAGAVHEDLAAAATGVIRAANHGDDFFHGLGHSVGLDVHDPEDLSQPIPAGAVLTIEPGIYLHGRFGVRIEDDFLVTARGYEHLSAGVPRAIDAVEAAVGRA
ncbi:MAG TPA: Xaa-Pro peptidase family protein [Allosphingosinicella sp.]|nr:Xaa-Pro peptidase family protein [Allosphingosinicella sp.]